MVERALNWIPTLSISRPRTVIAVMILVVAAAIPGLLRLRLRTDGHALVPRQDRAVLFDEEVRRHFSLRDPIVVMVETSHPDGIFNHETLKRILDMSKAVQRLQGIGPHDVVSLATENGFRCHPGTFDHRPFIDPLPGTAIEMENLRGDLKLIGILYGTLVSADAAASAILVGVPEESDRTALCRKVRATVEPFQTRTDRVHVVGAPVAEALLGTHIIEDLLYLVPLAVAMIALVVLAGCRRFWGVFLALTEIAAVLIWTFGFMGWVGSPVYLTIAVLPIILTTIGLADEIHIFWHFQRVLAGGKAEPHPAGVTRTMQAMTRPVVLTSVTTAVGFLSFLTSSIDPVRAFGIFAATGILFCMVWSLTVIPAALKLLGPDRLRRTQAAEARGNAGWVRWMAPVIRRRGLTLSVLLLLALAAGAGGWRLRVQDSWIEGFSRGSAFRLSTDRVNAKFHGAHLLLAHLAFDPPGRPLPRVEGREGPLLDPALLKAVGDFEEFARGLPGVGGALGLHSYTVSIAAMYGTPLEKARALQPGVEAVNFLYTRFEEVRGLHRRREVVDDALCRTVVTIFLKNANYQDTDSLMRSLRAYERDHLAPLGARLDFAGDVAVSQAMIPAIVRTQIASVLLALVGALLVVSLLYRSVVTGLCCLLPASIGVLWVFGAMGWTGMPLGVATSMFCAITLGIGVDYAIHFVERVRRARGAGADQPVLRALKEAGPAIVADTLAIALGFGILAFSQVQANGRLGLLVATALISACVLTLVGLGALLGKKGPDPEGRA